MCICHVFQKLLLSVISSSTVNIVSIKVLLSTPIKIVIFVGVTTLCNLVIELDVPVTACSTLNFYVFTIHDTVWLKILPFS
jgi:hypothetical protein